jgi:hypothetical protein
VREEEGEGVARTSQTVLSHTWGGEQSQVLIKPSRVLLPQGLFQRAGRRNPSRRQDKIAGGDTARPAAPNKTNSTATAGTATATDARTSARRRSGAHRSAMDDGSGRGEMDAAEQVPRRRES